jgi:riboflavin kinase/FMN adenylyltransferase
VIVADQVFMGVANVGVRPTVNRIAKPQLETHLFDFNDDLYGQRITVEFCVKLRDEQKFESIEALKQQIQRDIETAKEFFTTNNL